MFIVYPVCCHSKLQNLQLRGSINKVRLTKLHEHNLHFSDLRINKQTSLTGWLQIGTELCFSEFQNPPLLLTGALYGTSNREYICSPLKSAVRQLLSNTAFCKKCYRTVYHTISTLSCSSNKRRFLRLSTYKIFSASVASYLSP